MAPLGRHSEPGPHRRCCRAWFLGRKVGAPLVSTAETLSKPGGGFCWRTRYPREDGWGSYKER